MAFSKASGIQREEIKRLFCPNPRRHARTCTNRVAPSAAMRARFAVDVKFGCKEEALHHLASWASEVGCVPEADVRILAGSIGCGQSSRAELEFDLAEGSVEGFLHTVGGSQHRSWERRLAPYTSEKSDGPTWQLYHLNPLASKPSPDTEAHQGRGENVRTRNHTATQEQGESQGREKEIGRKPLDLGLTMLTDPVEIEKLLAQDADLDREIQQQNAQGRKRNNVQGEVKLRLSSEISPTPAEAATSEGGTATLTAPQNETAASELDTRWEEIRSTLLPGQRLARDWKGDPMVINPGDVVPGF